MRVVKAGWEEWLLAMFGMVYPPLQAQSSSDETEPELSPKKFQTEKLPGLQKVCDIDCFSKDILHFNCMTQYFRMKPAQFSSLYNVMQSHLIHCRVQKTSCHHLQCLIIDPRRRLLFDQHHPKLLWMAELWLTKRGRLWKACRLSSKSWGWLWSCYRHDTSEYFTFVMFKTSEVFKRQVKLLYCLNRLHNTQIP